MHYHPATLFHLWYGTLNSEDEGHMNLTEKDVNGRRDSLQPPWCACGRVALRGRFDPLA